MKLNKFGFTLMEMVIVIVLVAAFILALSLLLNPAIRTWSFITFRNEEVAQARVAFDRMAREIRSLVNLTSASATNMSFTAADNTTISFGLSGNNLLRNSDILANGISGLLFSYYNINGSATNNTSQVRRIDIQMNLTSGSQSLSLSNNVYPRIFFNGE